ncbi:MAG: hypothetical protein ABI772_05210 [Bacteroidota bacterium]
MKNYIYITILLITLQNSISIAQTDSSTAVNKHYPISKLTFTPGIGLHPDVSSFSDLVFSNLVQWNVKKHLSIASHTSYIFNDLSMRNFNYIKTNYNFSLNQKFGIGTTIYREQTSHTFLIMGGIKYDAFSQTLNNPEFEKVTASVKSFSPDYGLLYNLKAGKKKYFFSFSMYLPVFPYPAKGFDINFIESNLANISLEMGVGIRIK